MNLLELNRDSATYIDQWIASSWPTTAAQAYDSFLKAGRGLLFIDLANGEPSPDFNLGLRARSEYVPVGALSEHSITAQMNDEGRDRLRDVLTAYEPEKEVIYAITRRKGGIALFMGGWCELTPRAAYEQRGKRPPQPPELRGRVVAQG